MCTQICVITNGVNQMLLPVISESNYASVYGQITKNTECENASGLLFV